VGGRPLGWRGPDRLGGHGPFRIASLARTQLSSSLEQSLHFPRRDAPWFAPPRSPRSPRCSPQSPRKRPSRPVRHRLPFQTFADDATGRVPHNQIPYKVDTEGGVRGPQAGYNICASTTPRRLLRTHRTQAIQRRRIRRACARQCAVFRDVGRKRRAHFVQAYINSIDDFCLWGAQDPNSIVGNIEGEMVAFCTKAIHGVRASGDVRWRLVHAPSQTRLIPPGTLTGVQFIKTCVRGRIRHLRLTVAQAELRAGHRADEPGQPQHRGERFR
jgi:hypothetical protein